MGDSGSRPDATDIDDANGGGVAPGTPAATIEAPQPLGGPATFPQAKALLNRHVFNDDATRKTLYCGCSFSANGEINSDSCGFQPRLNKRGELSEQDQVRAGRMEYDHILPASYIGAWRGCWSNGGRKGCEESDPVYNRVTADLVNLRPTVGQINRDRSNYLYGVIDGEPRVYGACDFEVDFKEKIVEVAPEIRGDVARILLYMNLQYDIPIPDEYLSQMRDWSIHDPAGTRECELNRRIEAAQGHGNSLLDVVCKNGGAATPAQPAQPEPPEGTKPAPSGSDDQPQQPTCGTKKYCKDMSTCAEARYFLNQCGVSRLDRDGDGTPCESLCK